MKKILLILSICVFLVSCGQSNSTDIINPDADFLYFFWATCPHCQELNNIIKDEDLFSKITVEKREVYFNQDNQKIFTDTIQKIGLNPDETGVPFVYDRVSETHAVWVDPALDLFKIRLEWVVAPEETSTQ